MSDERAHASTERPADGPSNRRLFFRRVAAVGGGAVVGGGALLALDRASDSGDPRAARPASGEKPAGYRLTDHIATYYEKARL